MMNKTKITLGMFALSLSLFTASSQAQDASSCTGTGPAASYLKKEGTCDYTASSPKTYIRENFKFNLSTGVSLNAAESGAAIAVQTAHTDGLYKYGGSSEGGAVKKCENKDKRDPKTTPDWVPDAPAGATDGCL